MIERGYHLNALRRLLKNHPVVAIIGARQVGKTTLARELAKGLKGDVSFFDLENPEDLARLQEPMLTLRELSGLVIIDEIQRLPGLFQVIRVLVDQPRSRIRFLILGSASPDLLQQSSESLAGRIYYHELPPFSLLETGSKNLKRLWLRGGFPRSYLAGSLKESNEWREGFIRTFLERDLPQLGITIRATTLRRFWTMLAHYHGQIWNASEFARSFGVADTTIRNYLDLLTSAMVIRQLTPWHENISKRQVKAPKVYIMDPGLLHSLLGLENMNDLMGHPKAGASWEGFVLEEIIRRTQLPSDRFHFWATHSGAELDLLIIRGKKRIGFEVKLTTQPKMTRSMHSALQDLQLDELNVIHAGEKSFPLADRVRAIPLHSLPVIV